MKKWLLTLCLVLCACSTSNRVYEVTLLDGTKFTTEGKYCEVRSEPTLVVLCKDYGVLDWEDVYVAKEVHRITEEK